MIIIREGTGTSFKTNTTFVAGKRRHNRYYNYLDYNAYFPFVNGRCHF